MLATRWQPMAEMQDEMSRLTEEMGRLFGRWGASTPRAFSATAYPPLNMWADDENVYVEAELPGFDMAGLDIFVSGNQLTIKGERKPCDVKGAMWHRQERGYGTFSRIIELPCEVDNDHVSAEFKNGVLTVSLPKCAEVKPRRIEVKAS